MKKSIFILTALLVALETFAADQLHAKNIFPVIAEDAQAGWFPLATENSVAVICTDASDYKVVDIASRMLADDVERVTGQRPVLQKAKNLVGTAPMILAGTLGKSRLIENIVKSLKIDVSGIKGKWESCIVTTVRNPKTQAPVLLIIGSDRRGTAFGLTSFVMDLAWDINRWKPTEAHKYIRYWAEKTFSREVAQEIADMQAGYYQLQAAGKDSHVWFVNYSEEQIEQRIARWRNLAAHATDVEKRVPESLKDAYFELVGYPIRGAAMINEYQLLARRSMVRATAGDSIGAFADAGRVKTMFSELNAWTYHYNNVIKEGKWNNYFNWQPYHWFRSEKIEQPYCTPEVFAQAQKSPKPRFLSVMDAISADGISIDSETDGEIPLWIEALTPIRNFSKEAKDNIFCRIKTDNGTFDASATPINNVWHAPYVGPMWSRVGTIQLKKGSNRLTVADLKPDARICQIYIGAYPPFVREPRLTIPAALFQWKHGNVFRIEGLGYTDGVLVQPFDTPSYKSVSDAPYVEYELNIEEGDSVIEVRTLPTLHVYNGRDARYAVQLGNEAPQVFSIHADDFTAEWRWNVLRGYASRSMSIPAACRGMQRLRIYLLDPGIVLQEIIMLQRQ